MDEKRLIEIYKETSRYFYGNQNNTNQKSKHWEIYNLKKFTLDNLINFRNDGNLSAGLDDQNDTFAFNEYSEVINKTSELYVLNNLPKKNIGNSNILIPFKDVFMDYNKLIHIYFCLLFFHLIQQQFF